MDASAASTPIPRWVFLILIAVWAILDGLALIWTVRLGSIWGAVIAGLAAATIPVGLTVFAVEERSIAKLLREYRDQSYAFLFGDALALPFSAAMAALGWRHLPLSGWRVSGWWTLLSALIGLAAGLAFHYLVDRPAYFRAGAYWSWDAPSKLVHDFCSYPVWFGGLVCVGVPLVLTWPWFGLMLIGIVAWGLLAALHDLNLDPLKLHPNWWVWPS